MATTEFGQAVRRWRERVSPEAAGLPVGGQRRTPGLRREEVSHLIPITVNELRRLFHALVIEPTRRVGDTIA
ncbi:hypothetical protein AB0J27_29350 [Micromonospora chokoriensis]